MKTTHACPLPAESLLARYRDAGSFTDCYSTTVPGTVEQVEYVRAFYCSRVFRLERLLIGLALRRSSSDQDASALAQGTADRFAAWTVEARNENQLLLADFTGKTRSWLMSARRAGPDGPTTTLYFGSAAGVGPTGSGKAGRLPFPFSALVGFHSAYSRALLRAAGASLRANAARA